LLSPVKLTFITTCFFFGLDRCKPLECYIDRALRRARWI